MKSINLSYKQRYYLADMEYWLTNKWLDNMKGGHEGGRIKVVGEDFDLYLYKKRVTTILSDGYYWDTDKDWLNELRMRWIRNSLDINLVMSI
jgi:hypothetical protein